MEILKSNRDIKDKFELETLMAAHLIRLRGYGSLPYDCACNNTHKVNDKDIQCIASAKPIKALLRCPNNFYTMVRIKGFFKKKVISEYGYHAKLLDEA